MATSETAALPPTTKQIVHCPRCPFVASARSDGANLRSLAAHLVAVHTRHVSDRFTNDCRRVEVAAAEETSCQ